MTSKLVFVNWETPLVHISRTCLDPISQVINMSFNYTDESFNSTQGNNRYLFWESYLVCKYAVRAWSSSPNTDTSDTGHNNFAEIRANLPEERYCIIIWYPHACRKANILSLWSRNRLNALWNYSF